MKTGLFDFWNLSNPQKQVKVGDCIVEVNGQRGLAANLVAQLKQFQVQEIVIGQKAPLNTQQLPKSSVGDAADSGEDGHRDLYANRSEYGIGGMQIAARQFVRVAHGEGAAGVDLYRHCFDSHAKEMRPPLRPFQAREVIPCHAQQAPAPAHVPRSQGPETDRGPADKLKDRKGGDPAAGLPRRPLDGRWFDSCGAVGTIAGSTMHWAHQADESDGTTEVVLTGTTVHMSFLGQMLSGVLRDENIIWSKNDVWRRMEPESAPRQWQ